MEIPVSHSMVEAQEGGDELVQIRIEEETDVEFDLREEGEYVQIGDIDGRLVIEYEINRGELLEQYEKAEDPGFVDQIKGAIQDWNDVSSSRVHINYGKILFRGTEPIEQVPSEYELKPKVSGPKLQQTSPSDLKRELRETFEYQTDYDELEHDIKEYLRREGIKPESYEMGAPVHIQARAEPVAESEEDDKIGRFGTEFTIKVENKVDRSIDESRINVSMPPSVGREVNVSRGTGSYNPETEEYEFRIEGLRPISEIPNNASAPYIIKFIVPPEAGQSLDTVEGSAEFRTRQPFSNFIPEAVYDGGGRKRYEWPQQASTDGYATVSATCSLHASFETPTAEIMVGDNAVVNKRFAVEGVTPPQAITHIEEVLRSRGIDADLRELDGSEELREGEQVTEFDSHISKGTVTVDNTRISIDVKIEGIRRSGEKETARGSDQGEALPAKSRRVSVDYGRTGLEIKAQGADTETVDTYVSDLRDELRLTLESVSEEA